MAVLVLFLTSHQPSTLGMIFPLFCIECVKNEISKIILNYLYPFFVLDFFGYNVSFMEVHHTFYPIFLNWKFELLFKKKHSKKTLISWFLNIFDFLFGLVSHPNSTNVTLIILIGYYYGNVRLCLGLTFEGL